MKKNTNFIFLFTFLLFSIFTGNAQSFSAQQGFDEFRVFSLASQPVDASLQAIATDIQGLIVNEDMLEQIQDNQPDFIRFQIVHHTDTLDVKLQRHTIFSEDFILRNQHDEELSYLPGLYYRGLVNDDRNSLVAFNFFRESVNGVISVPHKGNRIIGQVQNTGQYIIYSDNKMTVSQNFECAADQIGGVTDLEPHQLKTKSAELSTNCVKVFYEITFDLFIQNSLSVSTTMDWLSSVHNVVSTLYSDGGINIDLSDVLIWEEQDPYEGGNADKLVFFRENRTAFNGDVALLLDIPITGGVAYLNSLCTSFRHGFCGLELAFNELPTYSWTILVMSHELGHSLGSPHTHACFWNGDNTAIDSCGPEADLSEGCDDGPIPPQGGTIMSYCHLNPVGINFANGFHPQVANFIASNLDTKPCLGTDCIDSCMYTIADLLIEQTEEDSFTIVIEDVISDSWDYTVYEFNSYPDLTTIDNTSIVYSGVQPNTYYSVRAANNCTNGDYGSFITLNYLSEDDWCSGVSFTQPWFNQFNLFKNFTKTFYPDSPDQPMRLQINDFDLLNGVDFMTIYDGESTNAPVFSDADNLTGSTVQTTFFEATNAAGAITVEYVSDFSSNSTSWDITLSCEVLSVDRFTENEVIIHPNPVEDKLTIQSAMPLNTLSIFNINGKRILHQETDHSMEESLFFGDFEKGVYFIELTSGSESLVKRVIKK